MGDIGTRINTLIKDRKTTQKRVSLAVNIPLRTLQNIVKGDKEPGVYKIKLLADYFGVSVDWLLSGDDAPYGAQSDSGIRAHHITQKQINGDASLHIGHRINLSNGSTVNERRQDYMPDGMAALVEKLASLSEEDRKVIETMIDRLLATRSD